MLGLGLICLFLFCSKYMSAVNLAAFNIISHYPLMRILLLKLLPLSFSCNSRTFSVPHSFCYNTPGKRQCSSYLLLPDKLPHNLVP